MRFLGREFISKGKIDEIEYQNKFLLDNLVNKAWSNEAQRPFLDIRTVASDTGSRVPVNIYPIQFLYDLAKTVDGLRIPIEVLVREITKNGFEVISRYKFKCKNCQKEYAERPESKVGQEDLKCDECDGTDFDRPKPENRKVLVDLYRKAVNENRQSLKAICKMLDKDLEISDICYLALIQTYDVQNGEIVARNLHELIRLYPPATFFLADQSGRIGRNDKGQYVFVCPDGKHRKELMAIDEASYDLENPPRCKECNAKMLKAIVEVNNMMTAYVESKKIWYAEGEVLFVGGKYWPDLLYGYSPIFTVWSKAMALYYMDEYIRKYYDKMRPPRGILLIGSRNYPALQKAWDYVKKQTQSDPYNLHPLMVELPDKAGRNIMQYVDLTGSLQDLQFIDIRDEFKRTIGAIYGVLPLFSGDLPTGWNQEGLEMTVTNRAVTYGQDVIYDGILEPLALMLGVDDWVIKLKKGEITDELRELQLEQARTAIAQSMSSMGFEVRLDGEGRFIYSNKVMEEVGQNVSGKSPKPKTEDMTNFQGEPKVNRPSDLGGKFEGHPASGDNTSISNKSAIGYYDKRRVRSVKKSNPVDRFRHTTVVDYGDSESK